MNKYEVTIITKENFADAPVKKEIESLGGKVSQVTELGQKQLVFPIKKETAGYYVAVLFEMEAAKVAELNRKLSLKNEIIRHLIISVKPVQAVEKPKTETAIVPEDKTKKTVAIEEAPKAEIVEVEKSLDDTRDRPAEVKDAKPAKKAAAKPKKAEEKEEKIVAPAKETTEEKAKVEKLETEETSTEERLKALDEKLDELLKE